MDQPTSISPGKIILINGPSSAGKTTLALGLQEALDLPFIRFSFDLFMEHKAFPTQAIRSGRFSWEAMRPAVFSGIQQCVPALAQAGNNVLFDHIIETRGMLDELLRLLSGLDVFFVGLHCSLEELERREMQRGDRRAGEARLDFQTVHSITTYDLELDSENLLEENVSRLLRAWHERQRPNALDRMLHDMQDQPGA